MSQDLVVKIADGQVRGRKQSSVRQGVEYYSYQGIPYAKPPVGLLRFKAPEAAEPWEGVRDATKEGAVATAYEMLGKTVAKGCSEDCLFVNVYTTANPNTKEAPKPVMVWIHGGGFQNGSGNSELYGPDYLITEGIVLVTLNYRLGCLGFLSLQNEECPGNNGLKDMVLALKWVQRNICNFGGDPNNVTIFGESAGGAAVHYLTLSKLTKGLFHKAIAQSGSTFNFWASSPRPKENAFQFAEVLGCKTKNEKEVLDFFRSVPAEKLILSDDDILNKTYGVESFVPVVEPEVDGAFLTKSPEEIMKSGDFNDVPFVIGVTTLEGLLLKIMVPGVESKISDEDFKAHIPPHWPVDRNSEKCQQMVNKLKDFYLDTNKSPAGIYDLLSSTYFLIGIARTVFSMSRLQQRKSPIFLYQFSFDGNKAFLKKMTQSNLKGTCHGDDLSYLFHAQGIFGSPLTPGTREYKAVEDFTKLWTNVAKHGDPTPDSKLWKPVSGNDFFYLNIDDELTLEKDLAKEQMKIWEELRDMAFA